MIFIPFVVYILRSMATFLKSGLYMKRVLSFVTEEKETSAETWAKKSGVSFSCKVEIQKIQVFFSFL